MKICTFNVNSIRSRLEIIQNLVKDYNIDVLCMQEIKVENEKFPIIDGDFECIIHGQKRLHGVATCSKYPIEGYQKGFDGELNEPRFIYTLINVIHIINIYAPLGDSYGDRFEYKMYFYDKLFEWLKRFDLNKDKVLICGDFNISHTSLDVWDEEIWEGEVTHLPEERAILSKFLDIGFIDIIREVYKDEKVFTFYDYRGAAVYKNEGLRLDYILVSKPLFSKFKKVDILTSIRRKRKPTPSDHVPIIAEFDV
ncbi:exodeoxyribonuclease III [Caminibacter mediatlanticus]|uniref:Exodeoxyribonuclease III (XthA) n=1 Tax=Caminibacter mediatlanticus TB-2 TaxID=391592 RepID=A0AAI9AIS0_9BACT|nr:exodeoxyribonuclease III [Caminibacter mediatlanticus]EDM24262.1 exodeoxyribonuclease III (xthA) [Caminibacter mediatlanticus TB-2]